MVADFNKRRHLLVSKTHRENDGKATNKQQETSKGKFGKRRNRGKNERKSKKRNEETKKGQQPASDKYRIMRKSRKIPYTRSVLTVCLVMKNLSVTRLIVSSSAMKGIV